MAGGRRNGFRSIPGRDGVRPPVGRDLGDQLPRRRPRRHGHPIACWRRQRISKCPEERGNSGRGGSGLPVNRSDPGTTAINSSTVRRRWIGFSGSDGSTARGHVSAESSASATPRSVAPGEQRGRRAGRSVALDHIAQAIVELALRRWPAEHKSVDPMRHVDRESQRCAAPVGAGDDVEGFVREPACQSAASAAQDGGRAIRSGATTTRPRRRRASTTTMSIQKPLASMASYRPPWISSTPPPQTSETLAFFGELLQF